MREIDFERMRKHGLKKEDFLPKPKQPEIINISREDFYLLDATADNTIYYITEPDGTVTVKKGDNR